MKKVFYINFENSHNGALNRVGGLQTHLPSSFPVSPSTGKELGFLMQIYCDDKLPIQDTLCIQVYQSVDIDSGDDGEPVAVKVPLNAPLNEERKGLIHPQIGNYDIVWEAATEPDILPETLDHSLDDLKMMSSKLGGATPSEFTNEKFIGWVAEYPVDFNFGGVLCLLMKDDGELYTTIL